MKWYKNIKFGFVSFETVKRYAYKDIEISTFKVKVIRETDNYYEIEYLETMVGSAKYYEINNKPYLLKKSNLYDINLNWFQRLFNLYN
jgi:hypothetical protein